MSATAASVRSGAWSRFGHAMNNERVRRAIISVIVFVGFWEIGSRSEDLFGYRFPWIGLIPAPTDVFASFVPLIGDQGYWTSWYQSTRRVFTGFIAAQIVGIPLGLAMATSRLFYNLSFPVFEVMRPIPPLAWVPAAIIFWPTEESSIAFVTFLGAFYVVVINVLGGAKSIDVRYFQSAYSMGASGWDVFRRIILPATLPSIFIGSAVGMGITWEVVVAAEMISGGGGTSGASGGGLGFFIWNAYIGGSYPLIVVGMISIGVAGYVSSSLIRKLGETFTPWRRLR